MSENSLVVVVGLGEVGRPLLRIMSRTFDCMGVDLNPVSIDRPCSVLHVCYPYEIPRFVETTVAYVQKYQPALTIVHSTVAPGTLRRIQDALPDQSLAFSPVRGKHIRMEKDMMRYRKFVAAFQPDVLKLGLAHLQAAGFLTDTFPTPELAELGKLLETTYLGVLIAWTQEMERLAEQFGGTFEDVNAFIKEIDFLPSHTFPGHIGGHCVIPNIGILQSRLQSAFFDAVLESDHRKERVLSPATAR